MNEFFDIDYGLILRERESDVRKRKKIHRIHLKNNICKLK